MNKKIYIGIAGVARAGKNLLADLIVKQLNEKYKLHAMQFALAYELKSDCAKFIDDKFHIDVFTENSEEKKVFRDMLVWYGDAKRRQTQGRYWIDKLNNRVEKEFVWGTPPINAAIISDIRYDAYERDEVHWIKNEKQGPLIHVSKFTYGFPTEGRHVNIKGKTEFPKIFTEPANQHEALNDPKLQKQADYILQWEDVNNVKKCSYKELLENEYLNDCVTKCLETLKSKSLLSI